MEARQTLEFLNIQYQALIIVGLDIGAIRGKDFMKYPWKFVYQAIITCYIQYGVILYAAHTFKVELNKATTAFTMINQGSLIMLKVMVLIFKSDRMLKLIWDMNLLAASANPREQDVWVSENRRALLISQVYNTACWAAGVFSAVIPIIIMTYEYVQDVEVELKLPFDGEFPFEYRGIQIFILNYILSLICSRTLLNLTVGLDTLFGWCVHAVSAHFRILRRKVAVAASKIELNNNHADFVKDVGSIVRYHNKILQFIDDINNIFGGIYLAEVMISCLQLAFVIYMLNTDSDIQMKSFNALCLGALTIQMMIYCFGGEKVKLENNMLCADIYMKFPWEKMLPSEKKLVLLPLKHSQQETPLLSLFFELDRNLMVYIFIVNYILSLRYVCTFANLAIGLDTLFGWCVHAVSAHFRILRMKVAVAANKIELNDNRGDFVKDVGSVVQYHSKILQFIDEINNIFDGIFLAEAMFSCLQMSYAIYSLNNEPNIQMMPFNVVVFAAVSIQIMIYCFGGEKVKHENNKLYSDIYMKFPWEKMQPSEKKLMLMPMMRTQQETSLVGLFFELDRNLLVYIYRTAFSFNTILGAIKN